MKKNIFLFALLFFFFSCGGDDAPELTNTDLLTQIWRLSSVQVNGSSASATGFSFNFQSSGDGSGTYAIQMPGGSELEIPSSGGWAFNASETEILLNGGAQRLTVVRLTSEAMALEYRYENYKEGHVTYLFTFSL